MIIIDFDSIKNNSLAIEAVNNKIRGCVGPLYETDPSKKIRYAPTEAIYWFSKKNLKKMDLERAGLPTIGANFATGSRLIDYLRWMMKDIDQFSKKHGMGSFKKFKNTTVYTHESVFEIQLLGAKVAMTPSFGGRI